MPAHCPACGQPLPAVELPVCAQCGARLDQRPAATSAGGLPLRGDETVADLAQRFFGEPVIYQEPTWRFVTLLGLPLLFPLVTALMHGPRWLLAVMSCLAAALVLQTLLTRRPRQTRIVIEARGLRCVDRVVGWPSILGVRLADHRQGRAEPERLDVLVAGAAPIVLTRDRCRTGAIQSLRNLAGVFGAILAAQERERT